MGENGKLFIITEKPSVAGDIAKALGGFEKKSDHYVSSEYVMTWAVGHLLEFLEPEELDAKYKRWLLQDLPILPATFQYKPKKGQAERLAVIKALAKKSAVFVNACDAGREGELIFREIYDFCGLQKPFKRVWLQSMTPAAIRSAFSSLRPGHDYDSLADAARCRAESDWLIGMNATRAMTKRLKTKGTKGVWSVGRVQTPTLTLIVKRELEHLKHRPEHYFTVEGRFSTETHSYSGVWFDSDFKKKSDGDEEVAVREKDDRIFEATVLQGVLQDFAENKHAAVASEVRKESKEIAPQLFDLTLLQREANKKFGMTAARTLQAAQRLYEKHKLLTYPRTDTSYLPEDYTGQVKIILTELIAKRNSYSEVCQGILKTGLLNFHRVFNNKYVSDHFAIIPTGMAASEKLEGDDARIFDLVLKRFLAAFLPPAVWAKVERITCVGKQNFRTRVQDLQEPGWRGVYGLDSEEESSLPMLNKQQPEGRTPVVAEEIKTEDRLTRPLPRFTEARLLSLMEHCGKTVVSEDLAEVLKDKGIGTPATRADIIENLIAKEYVSRYGKVLRATAKGIRLVDVLSRIPIEALSRVELTGEIESDLRMMEKNQKKRADFMSRMFDFTSSVVEKARNFEYNDLYATEPALGVCPLCLKGQVIETVWGYSCNLAKKEKKKSSAEGCSFIIWKEKSYRYIDRTLVEEILKKQFVGPFEFLGSYGASSHEEFLALSPEKGLVFCDDKGTPKEPVASSQAITLHEELLSQTVLGKAGRIRVTDTAYICEFIEEENLVKEKKSLSKRGKAIVSRMPRVLCGREMGLDEYRTFLQSGSTQVISNFKSKKGRAFSATLHLKSNGNFEFKFAARERAATDEKQQQELKRVKRPLGGKAKIKKKIDE